MIPSKTPRQTIMLNANQIKVEETQKVVLLDRLTFKDHVDILVVILIISFMHWEG